jgi:predicted phosphoribosyltransferase
VSQQKLSQDAMVLALPRGGVVTALEVAKAGNVPLDVVVVRKLGVPWQPELAMGAVAGSSMQVLDWDLITQFNISQADIDEAIRIERVELRRREELYRGGRPAPDLRARTVILVDDGLATGSTMLVAVRHVRACKPGRIIVAVPVGSEEGCQRIRKEVDDLVCLATPAVFMAVGEWYTDFRQVTDQEVQLLLEESHKHIDAAEELEHHRPASPVFARR